MRRTASVLLAGLLVSLVAFVGAPSSAAVTMTACADLSGFDTSDLEQMGLVNGQCVPKGPGQTDNQAIASFIASPGDTREWLLAGSTSTTANLTRLAVGTVAPAVGRAVIAGAGSVGNVVASGLNLLVGGLGSWLWDAGDDVVELPAIEASEGFDTSAAAGRYNITDASVVFGGTPNVQQTWTSSTSLFLGTRTSISARLLAIPASATPPTAAAVHAAMQDTSCIPNTTTTYAAVVTCLTSLTGVSFTAFAIQSHTGTLPRSYTLSGNLPLGGTKYWGWIQSAEPNGNPDTRYLTAIAYTAPQDGDPTQAFPGRTIEQTVSCKRPDGSTYTYSNSADASVALTPGELVPVAGLMCDVGDQATGATATLVSPGKPDVELIPPNTGVKRTPGLTPTTLAPCAYTTEGCVLVNTDPAPDVPLAVPNTEVDYPEGSPGEDFGTDVCDLELGDVWSGQIVYKATSCALRWAFVPSPQALAATRSQLSAAYVGTGIGTWVEDFSAVGDSIEEVANDSAEGCSGPIFEFTLAGNEYVLQPLNACDPPMQGIAPIFKVILSVVIVIAAVGFLLRPILASFGLAGGVK